MNFLARSRCFFKETLWKDPPANSSALHRFGILFLRIASITWQGTMDNHLLFRAAALSFYSIIGMGPMIALVVMMTSFLLQGKDSREAAIIVNRVLTFIAPSVAEDAKICQQKMESNGVPAPKQSGLGEFPNHVELTMPEELNIELNSILQNMVEQARSRTVGVFGILMLIFIAIQLLTSVETTFNIIWGTRRGRSWGERVVFYWTFISLGTLLGFGAIGLLSASAAAGLFDLLPFSTLLTKAFIFAGPVLSFIFIVGLLMAFYQFLPNTPVHWRASLVGACVTAILLVCNHLFSVVYVGKVLESRSFYGSVGIIPVLMLGLYIFWFLMLLGSQVTYAVQNVNHLTNQQAWNAISLQFREYITLASFGEICRRFQQCLPPCSVMEIASELHAPVHLINEALNRLLDCGLIVTISDNHKKSGEVTFYHPALPLENLTLLELKEKIDTFGSNRGSPLLIRHNRMVQWYAERLELANRQTFGNIAVADLLRQLDNRKPVENGRRYPSIPEPQVNLHSI